MGYIALKKLPAGVMILVFVTTWLSIAAPAQSSLSTDFESPSFAVGNVQGQNGWGYLGNSPTKGMIEAAPAGSPAFFGSQSLAIRTNNVGFFGVANHLYSATIQPVGESGSTIGGAPAAAPFNQFNASFYYQAPATPVISTRADGRFAELDPSSKGPGAGDGATRYGQIRVINDTNTAAGKVRFEIGWYTAADTTFNVVAVATNLNWGEWYRFDYRISLCDGLNGTAPNDTFRIIISDLSSNRLGIVYGATWESAYKTGNFGGGTTPRALNGFDFWSHTGPNDTLVGFIDNFSETGTTVSNPCLAPSAASVSISGRVLTGKNTPVSRALVSLTDSAGVTRTAMTNPFGYYRFQDIEAGQTVVLNVSSKRHQFEPRLLTVHEDVPDLDLFVD